MNCNETKNIKKIIKPLLYISIGLILIIIIVNVIMKNYDELSNLFFNIVYGIFCSTLVVYYVEARKAEDLDKYNSDKKYEYLGKILCRIKDYIDNDKIKNISPSELIKGIKCSPEKKNIGKLEKSNIEQIIIEINAFLCKEDYYLISGIFDNNEIQSLKNINQQFEIIKEKSGLCLTKTLDNEIIIFLEMIGGIKK